MKSSSSVVKAKAEPKAKAQSSEQKRNSTAFRRVIGGAALIGAGIGAALGVALS